MQSAMCLKRGGCSLLAPYNPAGAAPSVAGPQKHHERLLAQDTAARQNLEGASHPCVRA